MTWYYRGGKDKKGPRTPYYRYSALRLGQSLAMNHALVIHEWRNGSSKLDLPITLCPAFVAETHLWSQSPSLWETVFYFDPTFSRNRCVLQLHLQKPADLDNACVCPWWGVRLCHPTRPLISVPRSGEL